MPRVDDANQLGRRDLLVICWRYAPQFFALLPPLAQWELHRFYGPSIGLTDGQTLERIFAAGRSEPSLPSKACKHYKIIFDRYKFYADVVGKTNVGAIRELLRRDLIRLSDPIDLEGMGRKSTKAEVCPVMNPEPDFHKLAFAFRELAEQIRRDDVEGKGGDRAS